MCLSNFKRNSYEYVITASVIIFLCLPIDQYTLIEQSNTLLIKTVRFVCVILQSSWIYWSKQKLMGVLRIIVRILRA